MVNIGGIFEPNNHSTWDIKYRSVSQEIVKKVATLVLSNYSRIVKNVLSVEQFDGTEVNSNNFRLVFTDVNDSKSYMLVRIHKAFDEKSVSAVHQTMLLLIKNGCSVPRAIANDSEEYITSHSGEIFTAYEFIEGTHFQGNLSEITSTAQGLARFDSVLAKLPQDFELAVLRKSISCVDDQFSFSIDIWNDIIFRAKLRKKSISDEFDDIIIDYSPHVLEAIGDVEINADLPSQLVHSDLHPHNLITNGVSLLAIIDLDSINFGERMRAISFATHRLVRQYVVNVLKTIPKKEDVVRIRDIFLANYCAINPLLGSELLSIKQLIQHEALRRIVYIAKDVYYRDIDDWKSGINKQINNLFEAEYFG